MAKEEKREFKGIWIPKEIWFDERLSALEKVIFMEIDSLDDEKTGCYASNQYLAKFCQCTENTVTNAISKLKKLGFIELSKFDGRHRVLKVMRQTPKNLESDPKNFVSNNIIDGNNINIITNPVPNIVSNNESNNIDIIKSDNKKLSRKQQKELEEQLNNQKLDNTLAEYSEHYSEKVKELLREYLTIRKQRGLTPAQLTIILEDFKSECGQNEDYQITALRKAIASGWNQIVFIDTFKGSAKSSYSSVDNTKTHFVSNPPISDEELSKMNFEQKRDYINNMATKDMTPGQYQFFEDYCLARDENGNLLKF